MHVIMSDGVSLQPEFLDLGCEPQVDNKKVCEDWFSKERHTAICDGGNEIDRFINIESFLGSSH